MPQFPSVDWFDEVRKVFNNDESYHGGGGGACDTAFGVVVGKQYFRLVMEGLECTNAEPIKKKDLASLDFYLEMEPELWRAMIENIEEHGSASLDYTLNTLDLDRGERLAKSISGDQYKEDLFFRYNQTLQYFFDASARVETTF